MNTTEQSLSDALIQMKEAKPFLDLLAKYNMISILGNTYLKKDKEGKRQNIPYTIFVPAKLPNKLDPKIIVNLLKSHIIRNRYADDTIKSLCDKYKKDTIVMRSLSGVGYEVDCKTKEIIIEGKRIKLKKSTSCKNGSFYIIDSPFEIKSENLNKSSKESSPAMLDVLYKNKDTVKFVNACAKYNLTSMLCTKFFDKKINSFTDFTVIVPKTLTLPKTKDLAIEYLKGFFCKRNFSLEAINKLCSKLKENSIDRLVVGTMSKTQYQIGCSDFKLYYDKDFKKSLKLPKEIKTTNGYLYIVSKI